MRQRCDECGQDAWLLVELGEGGPSDDGIRTANLCRACLVAALALIDNE